MSDTSDEMSWNEAVRTILARAGGPLHYGEITDRIISDGLRRSLGATPKDTVASILSVSAKGASSLYERVDRGIYALRDRQQGEASSPPQDRPDPDPDAVEEAGALQAFGMLWQRGAVVWTSGRTQLLGKQNAAAQAVDFAGQIGVYLLHDRERVIYVGRASESLVTRLKAHTTDRLGGRWDRFSWFGLRRVEKDGTLAAKTVPWTETVVIDTMEALLIESLEPPLNRKRGDNLAAVEYLQSVDPRIERNRQRAMLEEMMRRIDQPSDPDLQRLE